MSRTLKRVSIDFDWPLHETWEGYVNPYFRPCPEAERGLCHHGETSASAWVGAVASLIAMLGDEAVREPMVPELRQRGQIFPHPYLEAFAFAPRADLPRLFMERLHAEKDSVTRDRMLREEIAARPSRLLPLTEEMAEFVTGMIGRRPTPPFGNPEIDIYRKLLAIAGITRKSGWGTCKTCKGKGMHPDAVLAYDAWEPTEPPEGPGWQLWETVTEGSPISPVFGDREGFIRHLVSLGNSQKAAEVFCKRGWAPSGMMVEGKMYEGIESCAIEDER